MSSSRRIGSEDSETRKQLLDAADQLLRTEGHGALTVRRIAAHAGLKRQIVHYYFRSMEELYLEMASRTCDRYLQRQEDALNSDKPMRGLWALVTNPGGIRVEIEYMALANHYESVRKVLAHYLAQTRSAHTKAIEKAAEDYAPITSGKSKAVVDKHGADTIAMILRGVARSMVIEENMGIFDGHSGVFALIDNLLEAVEPD